MLISIIIPVYNRPDEIEELLESMSLQTDLDFEMVIVEDGSAIKCDMIVDKYKDKLRIKYLFKINEKPAIARNYGMQHATGDYFIFLDSDCIIPAHYIANVKKELENNYVDAFGGPDNAHSTFSTLQKAINYSMTSVITTGGIRGDEKIDKFYPRSFNMGISKKVFEDTGGFPITKMHPGEDMVFAIEIIKRGFKTRLIKDAYVFHKRRTSLPVFYKQVFRFGKTRIIISKFYPETFKIFYLLPSAFALGSLFLLLLAFWKVAFILPLIFFALIILLHSFYMNKNLSVAFLSVTTTFYQLFGYGFGALDSFIKMYILKKDEYNILEKGFYPKK